MFVVSFDLLPQMYTLINLFPFELQLTRIEAVCTAVVCKNFNNRLRRCSFMTSSCTNSDSHFFQGNYTSATLLFSHMPSDGVSPDATTYAMMLNIFSRYILYLYCWLDVIIGSMSFSSKIGKLEFSR